MNTSEICRTCNILRERDLEQYSMKIRKPVLEDKGKYIALLQPVSKMHHEWIMKKS